MKNFIFALIAVMIVSLSIMPAPAQAADPLKGHKIGDKIVFGTGLVGELTGVDAKTGKGIFKSTIDAPKYLDDLKTAIKTDWIRSGNGFVTKDNQFKASVVGNKTTVTYDSKSMSWKPDLIVANKIIDIPAAIPINDPLNSNYGLNTLAWYYNNGMIRYLRQIEGVLMDYYVVSYAPAGDIVIRDHVEKLNGFDYDREVWAVDANYRHIPISQGDGLKIVRLADLKDVAYPVTIDPTTTYTTSASDGDLYGHIAFNGYTLIHNASSDGDGSGYVSITDESSSTVTYIGQYNYDGSGGIYDLWRAYYFFDTSSLGASCNITAAILSLYGQTDKSDTNFTLTVQTGTSSTYPHDPLVENDYYYSYYTGSGGTLDTTSFSTSTYDNITLNATGITWINKTGTTKLIVRSLEDINSSAPGTDVNEYVLIKSYEAGAGYRPQLYITYSVNIPTVTTGATTAITTTTATFNGNITATDENCTMRGFVWNGSTHADPGNVAPASSGYSASENTTGSYAAGAYTYNKTGLTKGATYYLRAFAKNSAGYAYGSEVSFAMIGDPVITTQAATSVTTSTARLQAYLNSSGGDNCTVRWGYGTTDNTTNITNYQHYTSYSGAWQTGDSPYLDITGLVASKVYYFNVQASNGIADNTTGTSTSFTTESGVSAPTNVSAIMTGTTVTLSWVRGTGAPQTKVRFAVNGCPTDNTSGTALPITIQSTYLHTGLTQGNDYCYLLWGYDPVVGYSSTAVTVHATTTSENTTVSENATVFPAGFLSDPDASRLNGKFFLDPIMQKNAESAGMPINWFYLIICIVISGFFSVLGFMAIKKPLVPLAIFTFGLLIGFGMGIIPGYGIALIALIDVGFIILELRGIV
jgi:hypothetical protein